MKRIILNSIKTPDGTILISHHVHDYQAYKDKNGEIYRIDGGHEYLRRSSNKIPATEMSIYEDAPFEIIRENYYRGTFNKEGHRCWVKLSEMSNNHILNCIRFNELKFNANCFANAIYEQEIKYRGTNKIFIEDRQYE